MAMIAENLAHWDEVTPHHVVSPMYRTEDFRRGEIVLDPVVRDAVGDVRGRRLLHLLCHFGLDTLSLARMGAHVTGLHFSPAAIGQARSLAAEAGIEASFVCADVLDPPAGLTGSTSPSPPGARSTGSAISAPGCGWRRTRSGPAAGSSSARAIRCCRCWTRTPAPARR
jgi:hypothetical protein